MKGDFSRSDREHQKGYSAVHMQQGRVQLDADWNEQVAITRHAIEARTRDMLGRGGAPGAGFAISVRPTPSSSNALVVGHGRCYVDGLLCENPAPELVEDARAEAGQAEGGVSLAYLEVWERHVTALEDPRLREPALGGADTTTRTQTVWRVALLPIQAPAGEAPPSNGKPGQGWRPEWERFVAERGRRAYLEAWCDDVGDPPANQLYRVEVHAVDDGTPRLKWSRENGAVAFPLVGLELAASDGARGAARLGEAVDMDEPDLDEPLEPGVAEAAVAVTQAVPEEAKEEVKVAWQRSALLTARALHLERDPQALAPGDTVELEGGSSSGDASATVLAVVTAVRLLPGVGPHLGRTVAHLRLRADGDEAAGLLARLGRPDGAPGAAAELQAVLRRWDRPEGDPRPALVEGPELIAVKAGEAYALEHGLRVRVGAIEHMRRGDYWQFTTRADEPLGRWPARQPDGPSHHYAPLALVEYGAEGWRVLDDLRPQFQSIPELTAALAVERQRLDEARKVVTDMYAALTALREEVAFLRRRVEGVRGQVDQEYMADAALEVGAVVAADPARAAHIVPAGEGNAALVIGVVAEILQRPGVASLVYRVVTYGRAPSRVLGPVEPGDLLVVSDLPGHARRAGLYVRPGTLLGKALAGATPGEDSGSGLVDALVMLG